MIEISSTYPVCGAPGAIASNSNGSANMPSVCAAISAIVSYTVSKTLPSSTGTTRYSSRSVWGGPPCGMASAKIAPDITSTVSRAASE